MPVCIVVLYDRHTLILAAAIVLTEPNRLGLVQTRGESHTAEHLDLLSGLHLLLAVGCLQAVC